MGMLRLRPWGAGFYAALLLSAPVRATSQCPPEFGQKDPLVDVLGWLVVAVGVIAGGLFFACLVRRSRGMRWRYRAVVIALGLCGMVLVWVGGFALAFVNFFFEC